MSEMQAEQPQNQHPIPEEPDPPKDEPMDQDVDLHKTEEQEKPHEDSKEESKEESKPDTQEAEDEDEPEDDEDEEGGEGGSGETRCVCGNTGGFGLHKSSYQSNEHLPDEESYGFMIQCETCGCWQHGVCVGLVEEKYAPEIYYCEQCRPDMHPIVIPGYVLLISEIPQLTQPL